MAKNVVGTSLESCCLDPVTGFFRDGFCQTNDMDAGIHTVCALMTEEFLNYSKSQGNDLTTANEESGFPGLRPGDKWCVCAARWWQAYEDGCAPPVALQATHERTLEFIPLSILKEHSN